MKRLKYAKKTKTPTTITKTKKFIKGSVGEVRTLTGGVAPSFYKVKTKKLTKRTGEQEPRGEGGSKAIGLTEERDLGQKVKKISGKKYARKVLKGKQEKTKKRGTRYTTRGKFAKGKTIYEKTTRTRTAPEPDDRFDMGGIVNKMDMMKKGGKLKMVKGPDGNMVPFYAADGKGKMAMGGAMKEMKMRMGGKMEKYMGGGKMYKMMYGGKAKGKMEGGSMGQLD
jgi:hypothetical protein